MGLPTGCLNQCCFTLGPPEQNICYHVMGEDFTAEQATTDHESCYTRMLDTEETIECLGCDVGCRIGLDSPDLLVFQAAGLDGTRFMRPHPTLFSRDAYGRVVDLVANQPRLINSIASWETGAGHRQEQSLALVECFDIHPCYLIPDTGCGSPETSFIRGGFQVAGTLMNGNKFPLRTGVTGSDHLYCRKFTDVQLNRQVTVALQDYQTHFITFGNRESDSTEDDHRSYTQNRLVLCSAKVAGSSDCDFIEGGTPTGCAGLDRASLDTYAPNNCNRIYDEVVIANATARFKEHAYLPAEELARTQLKNAVLVKVFSETFGPPGSTVQFDRLDHLAASGGNQFLGQYARSYNGANSGESIDDLIKVADLTGLTKIGHNSITAELVIWKVVINSRIFLHHGFHLTPITNPQFPRRYYVTPHAVVTVEADLAIRIVDDGGATITLDPSYQQFPTVAPAGNLIRWKWGGVDVMPPRRLRWIGQLNSFSDPPSNREQIMETSGSISVQCAATADAVSPMLVPGAASNIESDAADRNKHYIGHLEYRFDQTPGYAACT